MLLLLPLTAIIISLIMIVICIVTIRSHKVSLFLSRNMYIYDNKLSTQPNHTRFAAMHKFMDEGPTYFKILFSFKKITRENFYTSQQIKTYF